MIAEDDVLENDDSIPGADAVPTSDEREAFERLGREMTPPPELEDRVVRTAAERGLVAPDGTSDSGAGERAGRRAGAGEGAERRTGAAPSIGRTAGSPWRRPVVRTALAAAATIAILLTGAALGRATMEAPVATMPRGQFALMLYQGREYDDDSAANAQERFGDYNRWIAGLRGSGHFITGELFTADGVVLVPGPSDPGAGIRPPLAEERLPLSEDGMLGAFFLINANDYEEAVRIARTTPHLRYGGRIAVRRIDPI